GVSAFAGLDVPESNADPLAGRDGLAIGRKGDGAVPAAIPSERAQQTSRRDGPLAKLAVVAAVQTVAVRRKRHSLRIDLQHGEFGARVGIPELHAVVVYSRHRAPVGREDGGVGAGPEMPSLRLAKLADVFAGPGIPQMRGHGLQAVAVQGDVPADEQTLVR